MKTFIISLISLAIATSCVNKVKTCSDFQNQFTKENTKFPVDKKELGAGRVLMFSGFNGLFIASPADRETIMGVLQKDDITLSSMEKCKIDIYEEPFDVYHLFIEKR